ncbi:DH domain-containing protein [Mycena kentingensis (nom. inval.)]|nr:DH domain-containing protein [Mycena kentingensis (nom. inval.)]
MPSLNNSFRSKSRSPVPPSPRPATFLPPSHYAEAGGLTPRRQDSVSSESRSGPLESRRNSAFMPIASNSDSSFEFCAKPEAKPEPTANKRFSMASQKSAATRNASTRENHMTNLPLVEAQLLPTLRDTIDRMTRPPSRVLAPTDLPNGLESPRPPPEPQQSPPRKPLKSALRSPAPKLQLKSPRVPPLPAVETLKNEPSTPRRTRPRSRTDPGAPTTENTNFLSPRQTMASNIPRPRANTGFQSATSTPRPRHLPSHRHESSSSDLEMRCEREARDRRSLYVVNGVLSSESESEGEPLPRGGLGLGLGFNVSYQPKSTFASKLRARFTAGGDSVDEAAERRRKELIGLVKGIDELEQRSSPPVEDVAVVEQGPPRVMVSSSSGTQGTFTCETERGSRPLSFWKRSRSNSPAPPREQRKESSSRSPVIRQPLPRHASPLMREEPSETATPSIPAALRRHSVYYASPPPPEPSPPLPAAQSSDQEFNLVTQSPESVYDDDDDEDVWPQQPAVAISHLRPHPEHLGLENRHRDSEDLANSDAVLLALNSRLAAAREREAFGIPPSVSDIGGRERLSYLDSGSELARLGRSQWEDGVRDRVTTKREVAGLSFGAEKLFRTLSGRAVDAPPVRSVGRDRSSSLLSQDDENPRRRVETRQTPQSLVQTVSDPSIYEDDDDPSSNTVEGIEERRLVEPAERDEPALDAWQAGLPAAVYASIVDRYGTREMKRQELVHDFIASEEAFVGRLTTTVKLFVIPIRMQDSRAYIAGVPVEIGKLFDWLEDILHLHTQLLNALRRAQEAQQPVVERVADAIRTAFVPQLELYQPYLARLVGVAGMIAQSVADQESDFGEFVRLQEGVGECGGWSLEALLVDPVTRLGSYPALFHRLAEQTPKTHPDHVSTLVLRQSTEMMIQVMTEVKVREDEYAAVKSLSHRVRGLPCVAKRGRRILHQGDLLRLDCGSLMDSTRFSAGRSSIPKKSAQEQAEEIVHVVVLSDLIVFASRKSRVGFVAEEEGSLLDCGGVVRLLEVREEQTARDPTLVLEVTPADLQRLQDSSLPDNSKLDVLRFRVPPSPTSAEDHKTWISALERSSKITVRVLSTPAPFQMNSPPRQGASLLPKSPSLISRANDQQQQEREEREWFSKRFHDVFSEFQMRVE